MLLLSLVVAPLALAAGPDASLVTEATLKNGMKVLIWPDKDIPNAALYLWFKVGSRNEAPGITGVSHFFEHMMFNGAKKYGPGEFDRVMEAAGGSNNAFTSTDVTVYQDWFPMTAWKTILDLEQDRIGSLAIDPKMVESERGVVYSERRMRVDDDNASFLDEQVRAAAFTAHPYQIPVIGWPSDIETWTLEDLRRHFKTYYAPNNATLVLVGDVDPKVVLPQLEKTLGKIPKQPPPRPVLTKEPEQKGERRVRVVEDTPISIVEVAFHAPAPSDPNFRALSLLQSVLTVGESSRLHTRLVDRERVAIGVASALDEGFDPGLLTIVVDVAEGQDTARVEALIFEELAVITKDGLTEAELAKAKRGALVSFWDALATINGKAYALGAFETFRGGWKALFGMPKAVDAVTLDSVKAAAAIFRRENATIGLFGPDRKAKPAASEVAP